VKINPRHIVYAWIVMICFIAGQWAVFAHYHKTSRIIPHTASNSHTQTTIAEKCQLCDAMHSTKMVLGDHHFVIPVIATTHFYKSGDYDFVSIGLILSPGRAPPAA